LWINQKYTRYGSSRASRMVLVKRFGKWMWNCPAIRYQNNCAVLHTDASCLPARRKAWSAWNYQSIK
jgi:hypothetical protein